MTYVVCEPCIGTIDKACVGVCPVDCFYIEEGVDEQIYIHPDECTDCGACEPECPVEAIFMEDDVPEKWHAFIAKQEKYFVDDDGNPIERTVATPKDD